MQGANSKQGQEDMIYYAGPELIANETKEV